MGKCGLNKDTTAILNVGIIFFLAQKQFSAINQGFPFSHISNCSKVAKRQALDVGKVLGKSAMVVLKILFNGIHNRGLDSGIAQG